MGSMALSTFMMFVPQHVVFLFLTICCVGFFGIYVPYNESKKKGEIWPPLLWLKSLKKQFPSPKKPAGRGKASRTAPEFDHITSIGSGRQHRLEQLETLKEAGLMTDQEYRRKRQEILKGP